VFVDASSLVRWSRVVNLLIPSSAQGALTAKAISPWCPRRISWPRPCVAPYGT